jgi:hypothetical protein
MNERNYGYKRSTINKIIDAKVDEWIKSLIGKDDYFKEMIKNNIIVTGGCIASMLLGEEPNDFDIYFKNPESAKLIADYYLSRLPSSNNNRVSRIESVIEGSRLKLIVQSSGVASELTNQVPYEYFELTDNSPSNFLDKIFSRFKKNEQKASIHNRQYKVAFLTSNAITLTDKIQIIVRFTGIPEEIHKNFDFVHCTNFWSKETGLMLNPQALEALLSKTLIYHGSLYPLSALFRMKKFLNRGWNITAGQMTKIGYEISKLNLDDMTVLEEQLTGVDMCYFQEIIKILRKEESKDLEKTYLFSLIDEVFST